MTRRRKRRSRKKNNGGLGRILEGMSTLVLLIIVLAFGVSIASRFLPDGSDAATLETVSANGMPADTLEDSRELEPKRDWTAEPSSDRPVVVVENGCGTAGLARDFAVDLQGPVDVMDYRDADRYDYEETLIVSDEEHTELARSVLRILSDRYGVGRIDLGQVKPNQETSLLAPVRIILGRDFAEVWAERD